MMVVDSNRSSWVHYWCLAVVGCLSACMGCGRRGPSDNVEYAELRGIQSTTSLNGLGIHRRMWETTGAQVVTPLKLSPRLNSVDTLVLVGATYAPPGRLARQWLQDWLSEKEGRSVIYFGRDFDAETRYLQTTLDQVAADQKELARDQLARQRAKNFAAKRWLTEDTFCGWFFLEVHHNIQLHRSFTGPWAEHLDGLAGSWPVGIQLIPPDPTTQKPRKPSWLATPSRSTLSRLSHPFWDANDDADDRRLVRRSHWQLDELSSDELWEEEFADCGSAETLLAAADGTPLIYRVEHADYSGSQLIVVVNGAPLLNGTMVEPLHRRIGELMIEACQPTKRVAMLRYDYIGILVSDLKVDDENNVGLAMLALWPLSGMAVQAALLGLILVVAILPILGRPQSLPKRSTADFGLHIEALGQMLHESRDFRFGLKAISDYFTRVRRESPPEWLARARVEDRSSGDR